MGPCGDRPNEISAGASHPGRQGSHAGPRTPVVAGRELYALPTPAPGTGLPTPPDAWMRCQGVATSFASVWIQRPTDRAHGGRRRIIVVVGRVDERLFDLRF